MRSPLVPDLDQGHYESLTGYDILQVGCVLKGVNKVKDKRTHETARGSGMGRFVANEALG